MLTEKANLGDLGGNLYLSLAYQSRGFLKHDLALSTSVDASYKQTASDRLTLCKLAYCSPHQSWSRWGHWGMESGWLLFPSSDLGWPCNRARGCRMWDWMCPHITRAAHSGTATAALAQSA